MEFLKSGPTPAQVEVRRLTRKRIRGVPPNYRRDAKKAVWPLVGVREEYIFNALEPGERLALARVREKVQRRTEQLIQRRRKDAVGPTDALTLPSTPLTKTQDA